jgi:predicted RNA-binding protein associated with RNAse of E/G family
MHRNTIPRPVTIVYRRLPRNVRRFPGTLREANSRRLVIESPIKVTSPVRFKGKVVADNGYTAIWFVYRNRWYDIARFYDKKRKWIGYYCDIVKPVSRLMNGPSKTTMLTDLFLDLWITPEGRYYVLDEDELEDALDKGSISKPLAEQARKQMKALIRRVSSGRFPPENVRKTQFFRSN